ncbi:dTDP-4-dehydrorhamnose 3,5-epimerase [Rheinheimera sp.]|uniref:dTDP-4-dehydrorhamnose 3,5-epimerase n=1 Tax=Rheinheimera sp. TaxID=1869214 RepID=UPI00307D9546
MKISALQGSELLVCEPELLTDPRGLFAEAWRESLLNEAVGHSVHFVQESFSVSRQYVIRGLHYQLNPPQAKLIRVISGEIFDVAVDLRPDSTHFGRSYAVPLQAKDRQLLFIPAGFAHGFQVLSAEAEVQYKVSAYYDAPSDRALLWNDPQLAIAWPYPAQAILSDKDKNAPTLVQAELFGAGL